MPVRIPLLGASFDTSKLEFEPGSDSARIRMALVQQWVDTFDVDLGHLTEVDSAANVDIAGGTLNIKGSEVVNVNGVYLTTLLDFSKPLRFKITLTLGIYANLVTQIGCAKTAALNFNDNFLNLRRADGDYVFYYYSGAYWREYRQLLANTSYLLEFEVDTNKQCRIYITGGVFTTRTLLATMRPSLTPPAAVGFQINNYFYGSLPVPHHYSNFTLEQGYSTADDVATLLDIDGLSAGVWDMSTITFAGVTTGISFSYAYGAAADPTNWSAYKTLAQLQAESDPEARHFKLQAKFSSDGATQRTLTEGEIVFTPSATGGAGSVAHLGKRIRTN